MNSIFSCNAAHLEQSHVRVEIESSEAHIPLPASHLAGGAEAGVRVGDLVTELPEVGSKINLYILFQNSLLLILETLSELSRNTCSVRQTTWYCKHHRNLWYPWRNK